MKILFLRTMDVKNYTECLISFFTYEYDSRVKEGTLGCVRRQQNYLNVYFFHEKIALPQKSDTQSRFLYKRFSFSSS